MGFDENPPSPHRLVRPGKPDTKTNILMVLSILVFFGLGVIAIWYFAQQAN